MSIEETDFQARFWAELGSQSPLGDLESTINFDGHAQWEAGSTYRKAGVPTGISKDLYHQIRRPVYHLGMVREI